MITAADIRPGMYVADDFTDWARADAITKRAEHVEILWTLADGSTETETYALTDQFTPVQPDTLDYVRTLNRGKWRG